MQFRLNALVAVCATLVVLSCDGRSALPTGVSQAPQLDRVDNGGCPSPFTAVALGAPAGGNSPPVPEGAEKADRNGDGVVCVRTGAPKTVGGGEPAIDNNVPPAGQ
jgi:hypothetical protein